MNKKKKKYKFLEGEGGNCNGRKLEKKEYWKKCRRVKEVMEKNERRLKLNEKELKNRIIKKEDK
jgi:hypothetical protein